MLKETPLRHATRFSAWAIYSFIVALYAFSLGALLAYRNEETSVSWASIFQLVWYSSLQALLSASLSLILGVLTARSFFYLHFRGKSLLYQLFSFAWALPALVVIFALIGVWGQQGWLPQWLRQLGFQPDFSLYGLQGILFAHLFLNIPLVMKQCVGGLHLIPSHRHQLAAQLNLHGWRYFQVVEWPILKGILPYAFTTVFLLCFTSFPIVLMLGGSPKYSTLEVAIYQAITFEFDFAKAVMLIAVQMGVGIFLQTVMGFTTHQVFKRTTARKAANTQIWRASPKGIAYGVSVLFLGLMAFIFILPMANVVWNGLAALNIDRLFATELWQSTLFSLLLGIISALSVVLFAYIIALECRQLAYRGQKIRQAFLAGITVFPLILPIFLLAVGLFLLLMEIELQTWQMLLLVGFCNGLSLLPFVYHLLFSAMWETFITQDRLARSLGLSGFRRWWIVEKKRLIRPLVVTLAVSMSAGLGSFSVIAFFGSPDFSTLPYLLYQQLGSYRMQEAAITALVLLLCTLLPFLFIKPSEIR